jgi:diamine N-acetyltransferase
MNELTLREVTNHNFKAVITLSDTLSEAQKKCVASNVKSLAQAYLEHQNAWPRAIYLGEVLIGFVMLYLNDTEVPEGDQPAHYLWRFMIGGAYQGKGYGKRVLDLLVQKCREEKIKTLYLSCDTEGPMPYQFYIKYGFVDTGERDDDEQILKIDLW